MRCYCGHTQRQHVSRILGQDARQVTSLCLGCLDDPDIIVVCTGCRDNTPAPDAVARGEKFYNLMQEFGHRRDGYYGAQTTEMDPQEREDLVAYVDSLETLRDTAQALLLEWLEKQGHDRCWYYPTLFAALAEALHVRTAVAAGLPPRTEFEAGCTRYQNEQYAK